MFSHNPAQKSATECQKGLLSVRECQKVSDFCRKKFLIMIIWTHQKSSFHNAAEKVSPVGQKFLAHFWKRIAHTQFFQQIIFLPSFLVETYISVLAILLEVCWQKTEKNCTKNENHKKNTFFSKKFINMLFGTRSILFLQPESFCSLPKSDREKFFFVETLSSNYIYWDIKCSFLNPAGKSLREGRFFFQL